MLTTSQARSAWSHDLCGACPLAGFTWHGGAHCNVNQHILEATAALDYVFAMHGYDVRDPDTGSYNCRPITAGQGYSLHAYAIAIDVNWLTNPRKRPVTTDMPRAMVNDALKIRTGNNKQVWQWGGDFSGSTTPDPMHWQVVVNPADLATGIVGIDADQIPIHPPHTSADPVRPDAFLPMEDTLLINDPTNGHTYILGPDSHFATVGGTPGDGKLIYTGLSNHPNGVNVTAAGMKSLLSTYGTPIYTP